MVADFVFKRKQQEVFLSVEKYFSTFQKLVLLRSESEDGSPKSHLLLILKILINMKHVENRGRGRPKKVDIQKYQHMFRLNKTDSKRLIAMYNRSKAKSISRFLADRILNHPIKIIKINKSAIDFVIQLSEFFVDIRGIKTNYNQLSSLLKRELGEEKARFALKILEKPTIDFIQSCKELEVITQNLRQRCLPK